MTAISSVFGAAADGERHRIDDLARLAGIPAGTIRFYQHEGLIPPPQREGRIVWYDDGHLRRLGRIRELQSKGLPLALIGDLIDREERGEDVAGWLALDTAVFSDERQDVEAVPPGALERLGLSGREIDALVNGGGFGRAQDGRLFAAPGMLELTSALVEAGVAPTTVARGAAEIRLRVRAVAAAMAELGWDVFEPDRRSIEAGEAVADDVLQKLERMRDLAQRIVSTLFAEALDEATRSRSERFAAEVRERRR